MMHLFEWAVQLRVVNNPKNLSLCQSKWCDPSQARPQDVRHRTLWKVLSVCRRRWNTMAIQNKTKSHIQHLCVCKILCLNHDFLPPCQSWDYLHTARSSHVSFLMRAHTLWHASGVRENHYSPFSWHQRPRWREESHRSSSPGYNTSTENPAWTADRQRKETETERDNMQHEAKVNLGQRDKRFVPEGFALCSDCFSWKGETVDESIVQPKTSSPAQLCFSWARTGW